MNNARTNRIKDKLFRYFGIFSTFIGLLVLAIFITFILVQGIPRLSGDFMMNLPSRIAGKAGILTAWTGTLWIFALTAIFIGVMQVAVILVRFSGEQLHQLGASLNLQITLVGIVGLFGMAGSIFIGVYFGAWVGIGQEAREHKYFIWWVINRLLFLAAIGSIQGFAQFYLTDVIQIPNAATQTTFLLGAVALFLLPSGLII